MSSAVGAVTGIALATSAVIVVLLAFMVISSSVSNGNEVLVDPNGPEIQYVLFTRNHSPFNLKIGDGKGFRKSGFNVSHPTKVIIHGFMSNIMSDVIIVNKNAYLNMGNYNVFGMDWSVLCEFEYLSALQGVQKAGKHLGEFINWLAHLGVPLENIHLIGHSLGAHVAGIAGDRVKKGRVGRITGLDPAGPGFSDIQSEYKLDPGDAKLVDVIHTYMRVLSLSQPLGHVDFYPNGGRFQPGCPDIYDIWKVSESLICNHARAYYLFAETILNSNGFKSKRCKSVDDALYKRCFEDTDVLMGQAETYRNGLYYVKTKAKKPFAL